MSDERIPEAEWRWHGLPAHFILGDQCRFHLATTVGRYLVSTVGALRPNAPVREIYARSRGIQLQGKGDERAADYMEKSGFEKLGASGFYETMVFAWGGATCANDDCQYGARCDSPIAASFSKLDGTRYETAAEAAAGHYAFCEKAASGKIGERE